MTDPRTNALSALASSVAAKAAVEAAIAEQVQQCRRVGVTWDEIADVTGVSKPTALNRWKAIDMTTATTDDSTFDLNKGDIIKRKTLHDRFSGNRQTGISTPRLGEDIFLFTGNGADFDYEDRFLTDGRFEYNGEGLARNQDMARGNRAILTHSENHKRLHVFETKTKGMVEYVGEYAYETHRTEVRRSKKTGQDFNHIVFTLRPIA